jgi:hypothetical protein
MLFCRQNRCHIVLEDTHQADLLISGDKNRAFAGQMQTIFTNLNFGLKAISTQLHTKYLDRDLIFCNTAKT